MNNLESGKRKSKIKLSEEARKWYHDLASGYSIEDEAGLLLLQTGMESFDRMREAQGLVDKHGITYLDRYGQPKQNPACTVERDQRSQMLNCLKALNLDLENH